LSATVASRRAVQRMDVESFDVDELGPLLEKEWRDVDGGVPRGASRGQGPSISSDGNTNTNHNKVQMICLPAPWRNLECNL
jgi:hypothetical protein